MIEFDYNLNYKRLKFKPNDSRYRIGRGEQGVLLVRPYTNDICKHWRFKTPSEAFISATKILHMYHVYKTKRDFIGMDMTRKFLEMGFTRARRYANHSDGRIYNDKFERIPQNKDWATNDKAKSAKIFKKARDKVAKDPVYIEMRKDWRKREEANFYGYM